jgi:hypothetical protein
LRDVQHRRPEFTDDRDGVGLDRAREMSADMLCTQPDREGIIVTTGSQAITRLALETGTLFASIDRASVALQAAGCWPVGKRGGGRTTPHVEPSHLTNIAIAMMAADPITAAAEWVERYRGLIVASTLEIQQITEAGGTVTTTERHVDGCRRGLLMGVMHAFGNTLGHWLDGLLSLTTEQPEALDFMWSALTVELTVRREFPEAAMAITYKMPDDPGLTIETNRFLIKHEEDMPPLPPELAVQPRRVVTMPYRLFEVLRELAADTLAHNTEEIKNAYPQTAD